MKSPRKYIRKNGMQVWILNGKHHRLNKPAIIFPSGSQKWYMNGENHRRDGPAMILYNGQKAWYVNGIQYYDNKSFQKAAKLTDEEMMIIVLKYGSVQ